MRAFSCFRQARGHSITEPTEAPRKRSIKRSSTSQSAASRSSNASSCSNASISRLPPCKRSSDAKVEAMMMPVPEERASRCLRLSQPRTYSNIIDSMKVARGCRDWRNFQVFHNDEVDITISVDEVARRRAADFERKIQQLNSFSDDEVRKSIDVDMIG